MADHMLMVLEDEDAHASQSPGRMAELIDQRTQFADGLRRAGKLRDSGRLRPSKHGKRARRDGERLRVDDGPFADGGKALGAYYWVDASSVEEAAQLATAYPALASDDIDVRPLMRGAIDADKEQKPGKIFAFAVLGNTASEEEWTQVMERIDAETHQRFPAESFLGGARLQPPTTGRRVATRGERRAIFDGPFLESKEVIGGLFLVRMMTLEEAVAWAGESRFVVHGTLEIRELWRS
jgi:hypothetical protein